MNNGFELKTAVDEDERKKLWKARHEIVWGCCALVPGSKVSFYTLYKYCVLIFIDFTLTRC